MVDVPPGAPSARLSLAIVRSTPSAPGRPRMRVTFTVPDGMDTEAAVELARARAREAPGHRFQLVVQAEGTRVLWDSHAPS